MNEIPIETYRKNKIRGQEIEPWQLNIVQEKYDIVPGVFGKRGGEGGEISDNRMRKYPDRSQEAL